MIRDNLVAHAFLIADHTSVKPLTMKFYNGSEFDYQNVKFDVVMIDVVGDDDGDDSGDDGDL